MRIFIAYCLDCDATTGGRNQRKIEGNAYQHSLESLKRSIKPHRIAQLEFEVEPILNGGAHVVSNG